MSGRPQSYIDQLVAATVRDIEIVEDRRMIAFMEELTRTQCMNPKHECYGQEIENCEEGECVARQVHES